MQQHKEMRARPSDDATASWKHSTTTACGWWNWKLNWLVYLCFNSVFCLQGMQPGQVINQQRFVRPANGQQQPGQVEEPPTPHQLVPVVTEPIVPEHLET